MNSCFQEIASKWKKSELGGEEAIPGEVATICMTANEKSFIIIPVYENMFFFIAA